MAFTKVTDPTNNVSNLANQPVESPTALKAVFDEIGKDLKAYINNTLTVELESTTDGNSGLDNIGMTPIDGLTATTPQEALEELKALSPINIADGSIADVKLSNVAGQIKDKVSQFVVNPKQFGGVGDYYLPNGSINPNPTDDTAAIISAFNSVVVNGGMVEIDAMYTFTTPLVFDTSLYAKQVVFKGRNYRNTGFVYIGPNSTGAAVSIGIEGVANSGFTSMENLGVYGNGQEIDGILITKGQRYNYLNNFMVRGFDGLGINVKQLWLCNWGSVYIFNCCRAIRTDNDWNGCTISNLIIENIGTPFVNPLYVNDYVALIGGGGNFINVLSIESSNPAKTLLLTGGVTVGAYYDEANNADTAGVGMRMISVSGIDSKILSGSVKISGFNANQTDAYVIDLLDSQNAYLNFNCFLPTLNPNSYQKPIKYGTSKNSKINVDWKIFDGIGRPSRDENQSFSGNGKQNYELNGVKYLFGMHIDYVGKLLMTKYCLNSDIGRGMTVNSNNRLEYVEVNINAASVMKNSKSPHGNKDVCEYSQSVSGSFGIYADYALTPGKRYLFTTFNGRTLTTDPVPSLRVIAATQDYIVLPSNVNFQGFTQTSIITDFLNPTTVRFYPLYCENSAGFVYHDMSFIIDLTQFENDYEVSFDGMTTRQIENLIKPHLISDEFKRFYRGATPTLDAYRGDIIWKYPPVANGYIGWVATVTGSPATWKGFGMIEA